MEGSKYDAFWYSILHLVVSYDLVDVHEIVKYGKRSDWRGKFIICRNKIVVPTDRAHMKSLMRILAASNILDGCYKFELGNDLWLRKTRLRDICEVSKIYLQIAALYEAVSEIFNEYEMREYADRALKAAEMARSYAYSLCR